MTQPRMRFLGETVHLTRTTTGRMLLLKPDETVNQIMLYCLFRAAEMYGVLVHSVMVESNHFHAVVTDIKGELSEFMHWLDMMTAKNLIAHYEKLYPDRYLAEVWSKDKFNATVLPNEASVISAICYDLTNPVKDGLVSDYRDWPGVKSRPSDWMRSAYTVKRPTGLYFSSKDKRHREVKVKYVVPPALSRRPLRRVIDDMHAQIRDTTRCIRSERVLAGETFLGEKAVRAQHPFDAPRTPRVKGKRVPSFAAGGDMALLRQCLTLLRLFRQKYRACMRRYMAGERSVMFPAGTCLMRKRFRVPCDDWSPPWCAAA